ncbi:MAG: pyruvate dehydrogenase, partial [Caldilineaceae bacterium]|nr:pyruvate dehydrogenase [Caldilineaceae bacterium]
EAVLAAVDSVTDSDLPGVLSNLGGHDLRSLIEIFDEAERDLSRPTVIFAYTIKGWGLPFAGDPLNHSKLLSQEQMDALKQSLGVGPGQEWSPFPKDSAPGLACAEAQRRIFPTAATAESASQLSIRDIPETLSVRAQGWMSTQQALGQLLMSISRTPRLAERVVTISPDVSTSTNLSGWIIKTGIFRSEGSSAAIAESDFSTGWRQGPSGQHIELGISEMNLFMALGMFGLSSELCGQQIIPIGTVYDPFVCRGLDSLIYALYSGAKFIFAGTPSGITLAPEGGAHQSTVTPSLGLELPDLDSCEPCLRWRWNG